MDSMNSNTPYLIRIQEAPFSPYVELESYQQHQLSGRTDYGATTNFIGTMRDFNEGDDVTAMELVHYPAMTEKMLAQIVEECFQQWSIQQALIIHRVGLIKPAEPIVLIGVWSAHRKEAFGACRQLIEDLKHKAPFWKKEQLTSGNFRWVEKNTKG
jgi:molybdopterin synthase catalytic subunit